MTDISALQQQWRQQLDQVLGDKASAGAVSETQAAALAVLQNKVSAAKGLSRLKNPFIKATKIAALHHKQKKISKYVAKQDQQLAAAARDTFIRLGKQLAPDSTYAKKYSDVQSSLTQFTNAREAVIDAVNACSSAASTQHYQPPAFYIGPDSMEQQDAQGAIKKARQAVNSLPPQRGKTMPHINASLADWSIDTMYNGSGLDALQNAEYKLNGVAGGLGDIIGGLSGEKAAILKAVTAQARRTDPVVEKFAASLETYTSSKKASAKPNAANFRN